MDATRRYDHAVIILEEAQNELHASERALTEANAAFTAISKRIRKERGNGARKR